MVEEPRALERPRQHAARYEASIMRLGCMTTAIWLALGTAAFVALMEALSSFGLSYWARLSVSFAAVLGVRQLTLVGYRRIRGKLRAQRHAALFAADAERDTSHLPEPLAAVLRSGRALAEQIDLSDAEPEAVIAELQAWLDQVSALDDEHAASLRDLGLIPADLEPLTRLRRNQGELTDIWNERAYRRLHTVLPILHHVDRQLCRGRDDAYR